MQEDFRQSLRNAVSIARAENRRTQAEVAEEIGIDARTILNIENGKGNPKLQLLFPLVRVLKIDPRDIFYPGRKSEASSIRQLNSLVDSCSEDEARTMVPIFETVLSALRAKDVKQLGE